MTALQYTHVNQKTHRLVASRHPTVGVFDDLTADPDDLRVAFLLESFTNDRHAAAARIALLPKNEIITGAGASLVMAAFLQTDERGGRFTDGRLGAWYAAFDIETAIEETIYHNERRLRASAGGFPNRIQMRELAATVDTILVDLRSLQTALPDLYHPTDYTASQAFAVSLRWPPSGKPEDGIVFDSVRRAGGVNACVFWPLKVPLPVIQGDRFEYNWDTRGDVTVVKLTGMSV